MLIKLRPFFLAMSLLFFGWSSPALFAQAENSGIQWGVETGPFLSFAGLNYNIAATAAMGNHEFYLGPKWVLSDTYLIERGPWGVDAGYRYHLNPQQKLNGFFNVEYQTAFLRPAGNGLKTVIQEIHGGYGFQWQLTEHLQLGNNIGLGGVIKKSTTAVSDEKYGLSGFSFLLKLFVKYQF